MGMLVTSPEAEQDLVDIWVYIAEDNQPAADSFIDKLVDCAENLAKTPGMGVKRPELGEDYYSFPVDHYVLFYRVTEDVVELLRVLRASRDIGRIF